MRKQREKGHSGCERCATALNYPETGHIMCHKPGTAGGRAPTGEEASCKVGAQIDLSSGSERFQNLARAAGPRLPRESDMYTCHART